MLDDFLPLLKNNRFVSLWISQILSQMTINVMNFLLLIVLFNETQSAIATSLLWVAYALPAIFVGPFAASYVDMADRRKLLMYSNLIQSGIIFGYAFVESQSLFLLYGVAILYSTLNQFYVPSEFAVLPSLVKKKDYPLANGLFFLTQQGALIVGFAVAGLFHKYFGFVNTLYLCSLFIFVAFISVSRLPALKPKKSVPKALDEALIAFFSQIIEGYRFLRSSARIYIPFLLLMALQVATAMVVVNAPNLATDILKLNVNLAGVYVAVPAGVGAIIGSISFSRLLKHKTRKKDIIKIAFVLFTISFLYLSVISYHLMEPSRIIFGVISIMMMGTGFVGMFIPLQTHLQEVTPGGLRGRVFGNFWFLVTVATIFPVIASGTITELLGVRTFYSLLVILSAFGFVLVQRYGDKFTKNGFKK